MLRDRKAGVSVIDDFFTDYKVYRLKSEIRIATTQDWFAAMKLKGFPVQSGGFVGLNLNATG